MSQGPNQIDAQTHFEQSTADTLDTARRKARDKRHTKGFRTARENLEDLIGIAHRGYISGFYTKNPQEYGQNYVDPSSQDFTHQNAGMVTSWDQSAQLLEFEIKNQIRVGETIEVISPDKTVEIVIEELFNSKKRSVDVVHGGTGLGYIPFDHDPGEFTVMRKVLAEPRG